MPTPPTPLCPWGASFSFSVALRAPCWAAATEAIRTPYRHAPFPTPEGLPKEWSHILGTGALTFQDKRSDFSSPGCHAAGVPAAGVEARTHHLPHRTMTFLGEDKYSLVFVHSIFLF